MVALKNVHFLMNNNKQTKTKSRKEYLLLRTTEVRNTTCRLGVSEASISQSIIRTQLSVRFSNLLLTLLTHTSCHASIGDRRHYEILTDFTHTTTYPIVTSNCQS